VPRQLLVVDDDAAVRRSLGTALEGAGLKVAVAANGAEGLKSFEGSRPDLVVLDLFLPDLHGLEVLRKMRALDPEAAVIVVTASDEVRDAVEAMKLGAMEYLVKPYDLEALRLLIDRSLERRRDAMVLGEQARKMGERYSFSAMATLNREFAEMVEVALRLAGNPTVTVLIEGETGVGKEFLARAIHGASPRAAGPFVAISCAAIPETLLESELFGHEAGAFTDARARKRGLFELAEGGTLFLDEVAEMPVSMQAKLLRAIETMTFRRVGGTEDCTVDARLIAATNVVLEAAVADKRFREDLYYRLKVGRLSVPPLRARPEDLVPLAGRLLREVCQEQGRKDFGLSEDARAAILAYRWPGNVRELRNVLERATILHDGDGPIEVRHLPRELSRAPGGMEAPPGGDQMLESVEREHIIRTLKECGGNHTRAAKVLGISRTTLWEKLRKYNPGVASPGTRRTRRRG
jgi:DNA-binding NtrC family response regulator